MMQDVYLYVLSSNVSFCVLKQPFDEGGRRIATPSALSSTIGMRLFSSLDDGTGFTPVEHVLDAWLEEGIENSTEILQVQPRAATVIRPPRFL